MYKDDQPDRIAPAGFIPAFRSNNKADKKDTDKKSRRQAKWEQPSTEQWGALYDAADEIKQLRPWEKLLDTYLFELQLPGRNEPIYFSVMGRNGECYGISIYPGYESIGGFYRLMKTHQSEPLFISMSYQNCLICYFGCRNELSSKDYRIIKQLGRKYRGNNQWTYFRSMRTGFYPWQPDRKEVEILIPAMQQFIEAYKAFDEGAVRVDFEKGQTLLRRCSKESGHWENTPSMDTPVIKSRIPVKITDELYIARLKNKKKTQTVLSLDIIFIPFSVQGNSAEVPFYPRVLILLDETSDKILIQHILDINEDENQLIREVLSSYILQHGRPSGLHVRDDRIGCYVEDICSKTGIGLIQNMGMPVMDDLAESLVDYMAEI